jgi:penicillin-binding protein 2
MLVFDQLKRNDPQLRTISFFVLAGLVVLLAGLWWVQIVSARDYQANLETQSFRTVRIPAVRGRILDRNGAVLAENRPTYNVSLYLEELRDLFRQEYQHLRPVKVVTNKPRFWKLEFGSPSVATQYVKLSRAQVDELTRLARCRVASNVVAQVSRSLQQPLSLDTNDFIRHYQTRLALPFPIASNIDPTNIARFEEQLTSPMGVDLEVQSTRVYLFTNTAAHVIGSLRRDDSSAEGEESYFSYRLPDFRGALGVEYGFDRELRGAAGAKSVLVNNVGYRQTENIWSPAERGRDVVLTIDLKIQQAAEQALQTAPLSGYSPVRGAAVVMDVQTGDILAMVSSPPVDPNMYIRGITHAEWQRISEQHAQKNRATQENYYPGSVFKTIVGLAALESGLNPLAIYKVAENPREPGKGHIMVGNRPVRDTAPPGDFDFKRALKLSSNSYFIHTGLETGPEAIVRMAEHFHLGERMNLSTRQEVSGNLPSLGRVTRGWTDGNTANMCIGQDPVQVTPLQATVMISAMANGGKVLWPRLVDRVLPRPDEDHDQPLIFPRAQVRDQVVLRPRTWAVLHEAMVADTEDPDGAGKKAATPGLRICAKTGTAQVQDEHNNKVGQTTWFASFAPYCPPGSREEARYAVVVMVENGKSGGDTCAPVAGKIYAALVERERGGAIARVSAPPGRAGSPLPAAALGNN